MTLSEANMLQLSALTGWVRLCKFIFLLFDYIQEFILNKLSTKQIHSFLNSKNALVVHFSGCPKGSGVNDKPFPKDLFSVINNEFDGEMACSVIIPGDNPHNAIGEIGVILGVDSSTLSAVFHEDAGSVISTEGKRCFEQQNIDLNVLDQSLTNRKSYNEWIVKHNGVLGVFIFPSSEIQIYRLQKIDGSDHPVIGPHYIKIDEVVKIFPELEIYSFSNNQITILDKTTGQFMPLTNKLYM